MTKPLTFRFKFRLPASEKPTPPLTLSLIHI